MTKHPDLFAALAAPFDNREIKTLSKGGRKLSYVTARTVVNRLDIVLGRKTGGMTTDRENTQSSAD